MALCSWLTRRGFLLAAVALPAIARAQANRRYAAIVFDGFPIFDLRPVAAKAEALFPGHGVALTAAWRTRQFEYQWLRVLANRYVDFRRATEDALIFAARSSNLALSATDRDALVSMFDALDIWPDVRPALAALRRAGVKAAILSNMTSKMLDGGLQKAGLLNAFDRVLSTDAIKSYKPSPVCYQLAVDALGLPRDEILFAPFAGWDAFGALAFGFPTFWVNRLGAPIEALGASADGMGRDLGELLSFAGIPPATTR
jgi:2-haloacid dehalogenase